MLPFTLEERLSVSPYIQKVWRARSLRAGTFMSVANKNWELVVSKIKGKPITLTVRGPETKATELKCPADAEFIGIVFRAGTYMPNFLPKELVDLKDQQLPAVGPAAFWLNGELWEFPDFDNAEIFVQKLAHEGLLIRDVVVERAVKQSSKTDAERQTQRHFLRSTGLTRRMRQRIDRARHASDLLADGTAIDEVVDKAGYADQPHLTRSLNRFRGQTPGKLSQPNQDE